MADMNDTHHEPENFGELPLQPTGSGVADLEIAYERMRLADGGDDIRDETPTEDTVDTADSAAHPS